MIALLDSYADNGKEVQIKLEGEHAPIGPGKVERVDNPGYDMKGYYQLHVPAQIPGPKGMTQATVVIKFRADRAIWLTEGPQEVQGSAIVTPGLSKGGIHIGS